MANTERRRFLKSLLGALAGAAGTVVLASAGAAAETTGEPQPEEAGDIQSRADRIAGAAGAEEQEVPVRAFVNRGFRNGYGGGFRNGGFRNGGVGGGFRNGGFANGFGGGFRNGAFRNW
jgi:rSAM-associated Gly-rich repeat protein